MKYKKEYLNILHQELKKAMGCTEPIAISYLSSCLKDLLDDIPSSVEIFVSGNILKNVKSVVVPNTKGLRGIKAASAIGIIAGKKELVLECISKVKEEDIIKCKDFLNNTEMSVKASDQGFVFDVHIFMYKDDNVVEGRIVDNHTNIVYLRKNDKVYVNRDLNNSFKVNDLEDHNLLNVKDIY